MTKEKEETNEQAKQDEVEHIDSDLVEEIDDEEMYELVQAARKEAWEKAAREKENPKPERNMPRWLFWLITTVFLFSSFSFFFEIYSIPALEFLKTSARLSMDEDVQEYKKSVVTIATEDSKGTGFSISPDGTIITNDHVIDEKRSIMVAFPDDGAFVAEVVATYPEVDLAVLEIDGDNLPFLELAEEPQIFENEPIVFIGNPLRFHGIVNEGTIIDYTKLSDWNEDVVMIKAPVYRGNSGSPVLDDEGQVIGVVFATMKHEEHGKVGLFVPIEEIYKRR